MNGRRPPAPSPHRPFVRIICALLLLGSSAPSLAYVLDFESTDQSMWQTGTAGMLDESVFLGAEWDTPPVSIGGIVDAVITTPAVPPILITPAIPRKLITPAVPRKLLIKAKRVCVFGKCVTTPAVYSPAIPAVYSPAIPAVYTPGIPAISIDAGQNGAEVEVSSSGKVGLEFSVKADAGSVDTNVAFDATLAAPEEISALKLFSLAASSTLQDSSTFTTDFPSLSARADLIVGVKADIDGKLCALDQCDMDSTILGFDPVTAELISFNEDNNGRIRLLGLNELGPADFNFGDPVSFTGVTGAEVGSVTVHVPNLTTDGAVDGDALRSSGMADLLDLRADLDGIIQTSLGLPPVLGAGIDIGILNFGYDLLDIEFGPTFEILQHFDLDPTLMVDLAFSESIFVEGFDTKQFTVTAPLAALPRFALDVGQTVDVTPRFWLDAQLHNLTQLGIDGVFTLEAFKASFALEALGASYDLGQLGPLFEFIKRFDIADLPALVDNTFDLGGFNTVAGDVFTLSTAAGAPEQALANAVAVLVTGSPVEMSQTVDRPVDPSFEFSFDYLFASADGVLDVFLDSMLIASIASPGVMSGFATFSVTLDTEFLFGLADTGLLKFLFDGPTGSVLLVDNVVFPGIQNGDFDLGSVTGMLTGWNSAVPPGSTGFVGVSQFTSDVTEPGIALLLLLGLLPLVVLSRGRRRLIGV